MVIVAGTFELDPAGRAEFLSAMTDALVATRAEPGCLRYVMSADPVDAHLVQLFELWESKEHLAVHLGVMREHRPAPLGMVLRADIAQYEIGATGPVGS